MIEIIQNNITQEEFNTYMAAVDSNIDRTLNEINENLLKEIEQLKEEIEQLKKEYEEIKIKIK